MTVRWWRWLALPIAGFSALLWLLATWTGGSHSSQAFRLAVAVGAENTWFQVQNLGNQGANLVVDYYRADGSRVSQEMLRALPPGAAATFNQAANSSLPGGFTGAAVVTADSPIRTLLFKEAPRNDGKSFAGDNTPTRGFNRQYLPLVYSGFGEGRAWHSRFVIQNAATTTACVRLVYYRNDGAVALVDPKPGTPPSSGCPNGGSRLPPLASLKRDQSEMGRDLPQPFVGFVLAETVNGAAPADKQFLVATADVWRADGHAFASYKGFGRNSDGAGELATTVHLPIVQKAQGPQNGWNTSYQISTADASRPAQVVATYCCDSRLPGPGGTLRKTIVVQGSITVQQQTESELPQDFNGAATLVANQPIAVVVARRWKDNSKDAYSIYGGIPASAAGTRAWIPLLYRQFDANWQSWFQVQVADGGAANVRVTYHSESLSAGVASFDKAIRGVATFDLSQDALLPDGFVGSAVVQADKPIAVAVVVYSDAFAGDATASFAAFGKELPTSGSPLPGPSVSVPLKAGWNQAQWQPSACKSPNEAFGNLIATGVLRVAWLMADDSGTWKGFDPGAPSSINSLSQVCNGQTLWINVVVDILWIQEA